MIVNNNAAQIIGKIFIVIGVLAFIITLWSFDWGTYNDIKRYTHTYADEIAFMKEGLLTTWMYALILLIGNVVAGVVLITLGKILAVLQFIASGNQKNSNLVKSFDEA